MKIVINRCYGGFGISKEASDKLIEHGFPEFDNNGYSNRNEDGELYAYDIERTNPILIKVVEELGTEKASGIYAELRVVEIPDDVNYYIDDYDGIETIHEEHRSWYK